MGRIFDFKKIVLLLLIQIVCDIFLFSEETAAEKKPTVEITNVASLDTSFIGMPKEPVGLSNYDGKGIPGKFKKHKFSVNENTEILIPLKEI